MNKEITQILGAAIIAAALYATALNGLNTQMQYAGITTSQSREQTANNQSEINKLISEITLTLNK